MADSPPWHNADGLEVKFPNYYANGANFTNRTWSLTNFGGYRHLEMDVDLTKLATGAVSFTTDINNDGVLDGFNDGDARLPANASVISATFVATTAATGGTSFVVGTYKVDGTVISANSIVTAVEAVIANQATIGQRIIGAGALVSVAAGTAGVGTSNSYIGIKPTGTYTAGKGRLLIIFMEAGPEAVAP